MQRMVWRTADGAYTIRHTNGGYLRDEPGVGPTWTQNPQQGVLFATQEDAEYISAGIMGRNTVWQGVMCSNDDDKCLTVVKIN